LNNPTKLNYVVRKIENQCYDPIFAQFSFDFEQKNAKFFVKLFGENIMKIITSIPGEQVTNQKRHGPRFRKTGKNRRFAKPVKAISICAPKKNFLASRDFFSPPPSSSAAKGSHFIISITPDGFKSHDEASAHPHPPS
jgi:hypothetical protein